MASRYDRKTQMNFLTNPIKSKDWKETTLSAQKDQVVKTGEIFPPLQFPKQDDLLLSVPEI